MSRDQDQNPPNHHLNSGEDRGSHTSYDKIRDYEEPLIDQDSKVNLKKSESQSELIVLVNASKYRSSLQSFSPKRTNACILSSENTRVICSIMIAILVVFSNDSNFPHHIIKEKSIISKKPLYVMLITDVSIVVGRIVIAKRRARKLSKKGKDGSVEEDVENLEGAIKMLEVGLVVYQTIRGVFIDCSFYMVTVICGLSLQ